MERMMERRNASKDIVRDGNRSRKSLNKKTKQKKCMEERTEGSV